jgi:hypothetical protein
MKVIKYTLLFLTTTLLVTLACRRDDDCERACTDPSNPKCPNYDPCYGVKPPSAEFTIQESYIKPNIGLAWTPDDSVFFGSNIRYSSPYTGSEYTHTWYLGAEVIHDASFVRTHTSIPVSDRPIFITVSHVLEYPIDSACYPHSIGRDSVARTYRIIRHWENFLSVGTFRCAFVGQKDSFDFSLRIIDPDGNPAEIGTMDSRLISVNFHNSNDSLRTSFSGRNSVVYFSGDGHNVNSPKGDMLIDRHTLKFTLDYRLQGVEYKVKGRVLE